LDIEKIKSSKSFEALALIFSMYLLNNLKSPLSGMGLKICLFICFPIQLVAYILQSLLPDKGFFTIIILVSDINLTSDLRYEN